MSFKIYSSSISFRIKVLQTFFAVTTLLAFTNMISLKENIQTGLKEDIQTFDSFDKFKSFITGFKIEKIEYLNYFYRVDFVFMIGLACWFYYFIQLVNQIKIQGKFINSLLKILIVLGLSVDFFENCSLLYAINNINTSFTRFYFDNLSKGIFILKYLFPISFLISYAFIYIRSRFRKQTETTN
jgi:hypothetical protein